MVAWGPSANDAVLHRNAVRRQTIDLSALIPGESRSYDQHPAPPVPTLPLPPAAVLFVFVVLAHDRRRVLHINVTDAPTAQWTAQQLVEAFPWETPPALPPARPRCGVRGRVLRASAVHGDPRSQDGASVALAESVRGTPHRDLRHECLDHMVVLNETHLRRLLREYLISYHGARAHLFPGEGRPGAETRGAPRPRQGSSRCPWSEASIIGTRGWRRKIVPAR